MSIRTPTAQLVERIAAEEAERAHITTVEVLGVDRHRVSTTARNRAWVRLVVEEGFPILGVALTWGCHRRGVQRAVRAVGVAPGRAGWVRAPRPLECV